MTAAAPARVRWATALLVTVLSIAIAEVSIGSSPWGLLNPVGWLLLVPIYGAQTLLVVTIALRANRRPTLAALWCMGVLMGLYEFYITHVLWDSPWDDGANPHLIEPISLIVIAGLWHPFAAVILPVTIADQVVSRRPTLAGLLPRRLREPGPRWRWVWLALAAVVCGGFWGTVAPLWTPPLLAASVLVVWGTVALARRAGQVEELADALPRGWGLAAVIALVVLVFAPFVALANGAAEDNAGNVSGPRQLAALAIYAAFALLAWRNQRHARATEPAPLRTVPVGWRAAAVFIAIAAGAALVPAVSTVVGIAVVWLAGGALAVTMFGLALWGAVRPAQRAPAVGAPDSAP